MDLESLTDILVLGFLTSTQPTDLVRNSGNSGAISAARSQGKLLVR
ncbi:hypothetical protein [Nostoc sp. NMS4]|nr:hypothetical protein [Nostoc sp. NMS4]